MDECQFNMTIKAWGRQNLKNRIYILSETIAVVNACAGT
jgi:hypothetical protein